MVNVEEAKLIISSDLKIRLIGILCRTSSGNLLENEEEIEEELHPLTITEMFDKLRQEVKEYYLG